MLITLALLAAPAAAAALLATFGLRGESQLAASERERVNALSSFLVEATGQYVLLVLTNERERDIQGVVTRTDEESVWVCTSKPEADDGEWVWDTTPWNIKRVEIAALKSAEVLEVPAAPIYEESEEDNSGWA